MFLSSMRTGVFSGIFLGILLLGGVGLILSDRGNFFHNGFSKTDVVVIDGHPIKTAEFDHIVRRTLQSQNITASDAYKAGYIDRIVQTEVMTRLLRKAAYDLGIIADDKTVANEIKKAIAPLGGDPKQALEAVLKRQNMSEAALVETMRNDLSTNLLRNTIGNGVYIPAAMTRSFYEWNLEERTISYVTLPYDKIKLDPPTDIALAKFYEGVKANYTVPESRDVTVGIIDTASLAGKTEVTEDKIKAFYNENKSDFETPETKTMEQAVLKTEKEAVDVLAAARADGKMAGFSKAESFDEKSLPDALGKAVFAAKTGELIGPVQTPLGWHVAKITAITPAGAKKLEDVKDQIKKELAENGSSDAQYEVTNQIEDRLTNGEALSAMADEYKMKLVTLKDLKAGATENNALKEFGKEQSKILLAAFSTNEKESSALSELPAGKMFTVHVDKLTPAKAKDLKDVKADVTSKWTELEKRRKTMVAALDITKKLDDKKAGLEDIAKENGSSLKTAKLVRGNTPPAGFTPQAVAQIMTSDIAKSIAIPNASGIDVIKVDHITLPVKEPSVTELANIEKNLGLDLQEERFVSFVNAIERDSKVVINKDLIDRMYAQAPTDQE